MSEVFSSYPVLDYKLFTEVGFVSEPVQFEYDDENERYELQIADLETGNQITTGKIKDPRCTWYPDTHNLIISKTCRFTSAYVLFGKGGIVSDSSSIGVAVTWISTGSDRRGVIPCGELSKLDTTAELTIAYEFYIGELRGSLKLQTILYLKTAGAPKSDEFWFSQTPGTILGVLDQNEFYIDGNGSIFPIVTVNMPGKPLWMVSFNDAVDVFTDQFDNSNVEIRLNQAHPNYIDLNIEGATTDTPLFMEVLASAMSVIVECAKMAAGEEWQRVLLNGGDRGSIAEAIYHFVTKLNWDVSTPNKLAESVRSFLEGNT